MTNEEQLFDSIGRSLPNTERSQMFGKPCFKIEGKAFISFFQNEMVFKLDGPELTQALGLVGAQLFDPSGKKRPMKNWVQVPLAHQTQWKQLAKQALEGMPKK